MLIASTEFHQTKGGVSSVINLYLNGGFYKRIYYDFHGEVLPGRNQTNDFALIAIMPFAMQQGHNLHISGAVHFDLLRKMEESQDAWLRWSPSLFKKINISADEEIPSTLSEGKKAVLAYSGGLDSTYALHAHARKTLGRRSRDIIAGVLIHGFDVSVDNIDSFNFAKHNAGNILGHYGSTLTTVKTNWRELNASWEESHMFGVVSVISQFSGVVDCGVIASDVAYDEEDLGWGSNAVTNVLFSTPSFNIDYTGGSHSRAHKTAVFAHERVVLDNLRVCYQGTQGNCGYCRKCVNTKLDFLAVGVPSVPAITGDINLKQISGIFLGDKKSIARMQRTITHGTWLTFQNEKKVLEKMVSRGPRKYDFQKIKHKWKRSFKKRISYFSKPKK